MFGVSWLKGRRHSLALVFFVVSLSSLRAQQEPPYFVTYSSVMEEPGNLEIENQNIVASPKNANAFFAPTVELEYGVTAWWTAEAYAQGQKTANDSAKKRSGTSGLIVRRTVPLESNSITSTA